MLRLSSRLAALTILLLGFTVTASPQGAGSTGYSITAGRALTVCSYFWSDFATGWRARTWQPWNCSNGLPLAGSVTTGQAENWAGTAGQATCAIDSGRHYNHPTFDGATTGTVRCAFMPPASSGISLDPAMTVCSHTFTNYATGWRWHTWVSSDCSRGLPVAGSASIGWAQNDSGTEGQASCVVDKGGHYNHPTLAGSTTGTVTCTYLAPGSSGNSEATICSFNWPGFLTGWRWRTWLPNDCSHGLPAADSLAVGQSENGNGTAGQAQCLATQGGQYNHPTQTGATSGTVRCLYVRKPSVSAGSSYSEDLNGDGNNDSALKLVTCGSAACLRVVSELFSATRDIPLHPRAKIAAETHDPGNAVEKLGYRISNLEPVSVIGDHNGDGLGEVSVLYIRERPADSQLYYPALAVIDVDSRTTIAEVTSPSNVTQAQYSYPVVGYAAYPHDPTGRIHPTLLPGYADGNADVAKTWGYGCKFVIGASSPRCGSGFAEFNTSGPLPPAPIGGGIWFREVGAYVKDLDLDGRDDISLIYHYGVATFSGQTGAKLGSTSLNVTSGMSPIGFDSGRQYGVHSTFTEGNTVYTTIIGGSPVGSFDDVYCNVSRWQGVLGMPVGNTAARTLVWSNYRGFHSNIWTAFPDVPPGGTAPVPARSGDFADGCIHRFKDGQSIVDSQRVLITNQFTADYGLSSDPDLAGKCRNVQYPLYLAPTWTPAKTSAWETCAAKHLGAQGRWGMSVRRITDGAILTGSLDSYVWGWSNQLRPGGETLYLVENMPNPVPLDATHIAPNPMHVRALVNGLWQERGIVPVNGRPVMTELTSPSIGTGDFIGVRTLISADRDSDGLIEFQVEKPDETKVWVGWEASSASFVVKP